MKEEDKENTTTENKKNNLAYLLAIYAAVVLAIANYFIADLSAKFGIMAPVYQCLTYLAIGIFYHIYKACKFNKTEEITSYT